MAFSVFVHRSDSIYDDSPSERYQFPRNYLARAKASLNDWVIYYEPTKVAETRGYFAIGRVDKIIPDPLVADMFVALIEPQSYLEFAATVPFKDAQGVVERGLINHEGVISGRAQAAVRPLSAADFDEIVSRGLASSSALLPRTDLTTWRSELREAQVPFQDSQLRERSLYLSSRILRDRVFRQVVLKAYDSRCAVTGLRLVNGGGRAEVDAAHIKPVEASGPDCVGNGLALSGTAHWMFDRGLISANDDLQIIISRHVNDMESIRKIINPSMRILPANRPSDRPHPHFLSWHRENCFKS